MSSCCCSLAGTSACRTCPHNPNADFNGVNKFYVTTDTTEVRIEPYIETSVPKVNKDIVAVVRCKDCKYYDDGTCINGGLWEQDDFCSGGERK